MASVTVDGFAKPFDFDGDTYPMFGTRMPALRGFYLGWGVGDGTPPDREIAGFHVMVGGASQDLSPGADLNPSEIQDGRLHVTIQDAQPQDEEFFYAVSHSLLNTPGVRRYQFRDVGCVGGCVQKLPIPSSGVADQFFPPIIALVGFSLYFTGGRLQDQTVR
jgi:hypothetical protein